MTVGESLQLERLERKVDALMELLHGKLAETDKTLRQVEGLLTTTPKKSGLMSQQELLTVIANQDPLSAVKKRTKRSKAEVARILLWLVMAVATVLYDGKGERL